MLRLLGTIVFVPAAAVLLWLALGVREQRADFVVASEEPRTIDPQRVSWMSEIQIAGALFEGLTRLNPQTLRPEPATAESWEVDEAQRTFVFHVRPTARWSDGEPLQAEDFRYAWLRVLDPRTGAQYASLLFVIRGAEAYYRSRLSDDSSDDAAAGSVGINVLGEGALRVELERPTPYFLDLTSFPTFAPVPRATIERWADGAAGGRGLWTRPGRMVCNGAFVLKDWEFKRRLWLERNPYYWNKAAVALESIEVYVTADPNAQLVAYETGGVDLVRGAPTSAARQLMRQAARGERRDFHVGDRFATYFYRVNCRRPPLDNADVRKALSLAVDRTALCEHVMGLGETPADTYVPRGSLPLMTQRAADGRMVSYEPPAGLGAGLDYAGRVALARDYLQRSGLERQVLGRPIEIAFASSNADYQLVAEAVQYMWQGALGLRVELRPIEGKVLSSRIRDLDYDIARSDWFGDYLDVGSFLDMFTSESGQNRTGWSSARYDELIAAAGREADGGRRLATYREAERILCEVELPIIPLFFRRGNYLLNPRFEGVFDNVREILPIQNLRPIAPSSDP